MLRKKLVLLVMMLTLLLALVLPSTAGANCSGDNCGCGYYAAECRYECSFEPQQYQMGCLRACTIEYKNCAIACCIPY
jgi:hypothetical protein